MPLTRDTLCRRTRRIKSIKEKKLRILVKEQNNKNKTNNTKTNTKLKTQNIIKYSISQYDTITQAWDEWHDIEDGHRDCYRECYL